jgi:Rod binding domain-containing protein
MNPLTVDPSTLVTLYGAPARLRPAAATLSGADKARAQAQDFETMFVSSMLQHMFTGIGKDGPLGDGPGVGVWRSLLTEQFSKSLVKAGGIGIANQVYESMLARQGAPAV